MSVLRNASLSFLSHLSPQTRTRIRSVVESLTSTTRSSFYGQFGEDAFLLGYFEAKAYNLGGGASGLLQRISVPTGFYVDVGAFSPKQYSNTYLFYRKGWRGINIDPSPGGMVSFKKLRPRDINLELAVSECRDELQFYYWGVPAVVNTVNPEHAREWARRLGKEPMTTRVKTLPLSEILHTHLPEGQKINFLSVDAEGHDLEVLRSNDWSRYRPELVLAECSQRSIDGILKSETSQFLGEQHYDLISWIHPTLVFRDATLPSIS